MSERAKALTAHAGPGGGVMEQHAGRVGGLGCGPGCADVEVREGSNLQVASLNVASVSVSRGGVSNFLRSACATAHSQWVARHARGQLSLQYVPPAPAPIHFHFLLAQSLRRARVLFPVAALPVAAVVAMPALTRRPPPACFAWTSNAPTNRERLPQLRASSETMVHTLARTRRRRGRRRKRSPPGWDRRVDVVGVVGVGGDVVE